MRLRIFSDLHLEFGDWTPPAADADVVIFAGDTHKNTRALPWIEQHFPQVPVIYLAGNHEFYGGHVESVLAELHAVTRPNFHFLENRTVEVGDVTFLGCTLWTDFNLHGYAEAAAHQAVAGMNDYRLIRASHEKRLLAAEDTAGYHARSRHWLEGELTRLRGRKVVVLTHHAPCERSLDSRFGDDLLGAAYASNLAELVESSGTILWVHGHTHRSVDYTCGRTRILANQRGYPDQLGTGFRPTLVVEV